MATESESVGVEDIQVSGIVEKDLQEGVNAMESEVGQKENGDIEQSHVQGEDANVVDSVELNIQVSKKDASDDQGEVAAEGTDKTKPTQKVFWTTDRDGEVEIR